MSSSSVSIGVLKSSGLPSGYCHPFSKVSILFRRQPLCQVPYVDCPCCVPDTYAKGGDIDCDFQYSASPISVPLNSTPPAVTEPPPTLLPTEASTPTTGSSSGDSIEGSTTVLTPAPMPVGTPAPTIPPVGVFWVRVFLCDFMWDQILLESFTVFWDTQDVCPQTRKTPARGRCPRRRRTMLCARDWCARERFDSERDAHVLKNDVYWGRT